MAKKTDEQKDELKEGKESYFSKMGKNFKDAFGKDASTRTKSSKETSKSEIDKLNDLIDGITSLENTTDPSTAVANAMASANTSTTPSIASDANDSTPQLDNTSVASWDSRLSRIDAFLVGDDNSAPVIVPFASDTIASTFMSADWKKKYKDAIKYYAKSPEIIKKIKALWPEYEKQQDRYINMSAIFGHGEFKMSDPDFLGASSLMSPYCLTKLCGGLGEGSSDKENPNYMYDIRDQRRFYDVGNKNDQDFYTVSNPTLSQLINWSNADKWGRTPYTFQDFVYLKLFGQVANNRLLTLRRYHAPTYDNLNFPNMFGKAQGTDGKSGDQDTFSDKPDNFFAPRCTVVAYFGEGTDNQLSSLMSFSTGVPWQEVQSKVWEVGGEAGGDHQAEMDATFEGAGFGSAEKVFGGLLQNASTDVGKILSYGKMALAFKQKIPYSEDVQHKLMDANYDPYEANGEYENRLKGPVNRIDKVQRRKEGIDFSHSLTFKTTYKAKAIGGINPKAAMLDIMSNCMEMCSVNAFWWGGGHRFMVKPRIYPWHDGSWRDGFMEKLYQGNIFGNSGAIASVVKGVHNLVTNGGKAKSGADILSNIQNNLKNILGGGMAALGSMIGSISSSLFGEGSNPLKAASNFIEGKGTELGGEAAAAKGKSMLGTMFGNLENMWRSKVIAQTTLPTIRGMGSLLIGEPVGEWHLTVGNPLNPIMVIGNLIVSKMDIQFSDELGPDDFPEEMTVSYTIMHGMARDKAGIQSMFNRGMGKIYELPDYIQSTSESETRVDKYTGTPPGTVRTPQFVPYMKQLAMNEKVNGFKMGAYRTTKLDIGSVMQNSGNYNTQLITKFTPLEQSGGSSVRNLSQRYQAQNANRPVIRALSITKK